MATSLASRVLPALVAGTATAAYYATPDVIASRTVRGWTKASLMAVVLATSLPESRAAVDDMRRARRDVRAATAEGEPLSTRGRMAAIGAGVVAVAGASAAGVAMERWIFRRGQARAAYGKSWPHTRAALLYGAVAAGFALVPLPDAPNSPSVDR